MPLHSENYDSHSRHHSSSSIAAKDEESLSTAFHNGSILCNPTDIEGYVPSRHPAWPPTSAAPAHPHSL